MAYAEASDVVVRWGKNPADVAAETTALIEVRLEDVERMLSRRVDLAAGITAETFVEADVVQVEADAVLRLVRNPEGYISETDGNYTYMLHQQLATGKLEITDEEWETLGVNPHGMFVIVPGLVMPT
jgi:hypothetical protein